MVYHVTTMPLARQALPLISPGVLRWLVFIVFVSWLCYCRSLLSSVMTDMSYSVIFLPLAFWTTTILSFHRRLVNLSFWLHYIYVVIIDA